MPHMPATPPVIPPGSLTRVYNVRDFGAVGDGATDDTAAIQAALDAAAAVGGTRGAVVYVPASATAYMFSNLKLPGYVALQGSHMSGCILKRLPGATGTAIREKTAVEDAGGYGASGIWIRDLHIHGNGTSGDGIHLGDQVPGAEFNYLAGLENVYVDNFTSGIWIRLRVNAISCKYIWANGNQTGIRIDGGGSVFHSVWAESNSLYDLLVRGQGNAFFGIQTEPATSTNPSILVEGSDHLISGVYIGLGGNKNELIKNANGADRNVYRDVLCIPNGFTFTHVILNESYPGASTGNTAIHISEYIIGQASLTSRWHVNQSTGKANTMAGDDVRFGGDAIVDGKLLNGATAVAGIVQSATKMLCSVANGSVVITAQSRALDRDCFIGYDDGSGIAYMGTSVNVPLVLRQNNAARVTLTSSAAIIDVNEIRLASSAGPLIKSGAGTPEGAVAAPVGSLFLRTDGGAGTTLYIKEAGAGNVGWAAK